MQDTASDTAGGVDLSTTDPQSRFELIANVRRQLSLPPLAYSVDGVFVAIEAPIDSAPRIGSFAVVEVDGERLLLHVLAARIELREGPSLKFDLGGTSGGSTQLRFRACSADGAILGTLGPDGFASRSAVLPFSETLLSPATDADIRAYYDWVAATSKGATLELGTEPTTPALRVQVHAKGLARHTLFCGQSGSGKTFSLGVLLEQALVNTTLPMLVFDPNSDHVHLGMMRSREQSEQVRALPYDDAHWEQVQRAHSAAASGVVVADSADAACEYLQTKQHRALVFDLGSMADAPTRHEAALAALELVWASRRDREPVLIVLDEAHDLCPAESTTDAQRAVTEIVIAIAGEGRKFGRHLLLATQRPQKLHPNVVSQCDNLVLLRMNSTNDVDELAGSFSHLPIGLMRCAPSFAQGMALIGGPLVPHPTLVRFGGRITPEGGSDVLTTWATEVN